MRPRVMTATDGWLVWAVVAATACRGVDKSVQVDIVAGDSMFTSLPRENALRLKARLGAGLEGAQVVWEVQRGLGPTWTPVTVAAGVETKLSVKTPKGDRRFKGDHPSSPEQAVTQLDRLRIRYRIIAVARKDGEEVRSAPVEITQSLVAAMRQEYLDIGLKRGAPPAAWFQPVGGLPTGPSYGDYGIAVANPDFMRRLADLERVWKTEYQLPWQLNSHYRNPVHNRFHVGGGGSGPASNSWHQFGCAADLQSFPILVRASPRADTVKARDFWNALAEEALELGFEIEPRDNDPTRPGRAYSGVGHVHIELDCPP